MKIEKNHESVGKLLSELDGIKMEALDNFEQKNNA